MARQVLVIGLGQFGMSVAHALSRQGAEVMAVDIRRDYVQDVAPRVADALMMDATNEEELAALAPSRRDACICAIGDENREASIIVTTLLRQLGAKHVVARATDSLHARILTLVGAHEVVRPEQDFGERLAVKLASRGVRNYVPLGEDLVSAEVLAPESFWGRTLDELALPRRHSVSVPAVIVQGEEPQIPDPTRLLRSGDVLLLVGRTEAISKFVERHR